MRESKLKKVEYYKIALEAYSNGINIVELLMKCGASKSDSVELAYELQAGEYTKNFDALNLSRNKEIHSVINKYVNLPDVESVGVFGIGEAKNWIGFEGKINKLYGVELSFSRLSWAYNNLNKLSGIREVQLIKGDASEKIFKDDSLDIAITLHSIEPNGNKQGALILRNVINSASKYVLLFEPDFFTASTKMKERMLKYDYVRNISEELEKLTMINIIEKYTLEIQEDSDNITTCWIIEKKEKNVTRNDKLICPYTSGILLDYDDCMYSPKAGLAYSKIDKFLLLNKQDAVFIGKKDIRDEE